MFIWLLWQFSQVYWGASSSSLCVWLAWVDIRLHIWRTLNNFPWAVACINVPDQTNDKRQMKSCVIFIASKLCLLSNTFQLCVCLSICMPVSVCGCTGVIVGNDWFRQWLHLGNDYYHRSWVLLYPKGHHSQTKWLWTHQTQPTT